MARSLLAVTLLFTISLAADSAHGQVPAKKKFTNRLARETSPYLLMHSHNPTDWYAWGPEAFEKAKKEGKLVFLSIGYSSCYWCHVMERESFNNEEVAKLLNDSFVCIKVDREERPDIDNIYMVALQNLRASTGWPLSMFLMPDGRPIVGGTYWPKEDRKIDDETAHGFKSIIKLVRDAWKNEPKSIEAQAEKLADATTTTLERTLIALVKLDDKLVQEVADSLKEDFDKEYGGFGSAERKFRGPKFPMPCRLDFLLRVGQRTKNSEVINMVTFTLDKMALGGIYDQLGGGFHRYSTERTWTVPHFEKMLYDNAQLAETYARAYEITKKPLYRRVLEETLAYVQRDMMSPAGAFYSSQDAETHHEEGRCYVWTPEELVKALPDQADLAFARQIFGAPEGKLNFEGKYHILTLPKPVPELVKESKLTEDQFQARFVAVKKKLLDNRNQRDKPFRNEIALTAWSGEMIAGFAAAGQALKEPRYVEIAAQAADFVLKHQKTKDGRLLRTYGAAPGQTPKAAVNGYLEDYAFLVHGLLNLHDASGAKKWLDASKELTDTMIQFHGDKKRGGYYFTAHDHEKLFARSKDQFDGAQPSGNSVAALNLVRLWQKTGDDRYAQEAEKSYRAFAASLKTYPAGLAALAHSLDVFLEVKEMREKKQEK